MARWNALVLVATSHPYKCTTTTSTVRELLELRAQGHSLLSESAPTAWSCSLIKSSRDATLSEDSIETPGTLVFGPGLTRGWMDMRLQRTSSVLILGTTLDCRPFRCDEHVATSLRRRFQDPAPTLGSVSRCIAQHERRNVLPTPAVGCLAKVNALDRLPREFCAEGQHAYSFVRVFWSSRVSG